MDDQAIDLITPPVTASSLWHELLRELTWEQREALRKKGFPSDYYSTDPCNFCKTLGRERNLAEKRYRESLAATEQVAQDALAKAHQIRREAYENAPVEVRELAGAVKALAERDIHIELPPPPDVHIVNNIPETSPSDEPAEPVKQTVRVRKAHPEDDVSMMIDEETGDLIVTEGKAHRGTICKAIWEYDPFTKEWVDTGERVDE